MNSHFNALFTSSRRRAEPDHKVGAWPSYAAPLRLASAGDNARDQKRRYTVDLPRQMAQYELNYARLRKLLPNLSDQDQWIIAVDHGERTSRLTVNAVQRAPYTTTLEISQDAVNEHCDASAWTHLPRLTVCMYHDADMAEVTAWEQHRRLQPRYEYPNKHMYQRDEKFQLNRFLGDWLAVYEVHGRMDSRCYGLDMPAR